MPRFRYVAFVLFAMAAVFLASITSKARACDYGGGGVVAPAGAAFYAPQFAPAYAPAFVPQYAPVYAAPQRVIVQRQVAYASAVVAAPVVKQRVVVRNRVPLFGRRARVNVVAGAAVAY
jgi:hypothetical protein